MATGTLPASGMDDPGLLSASDTSNVSRLFAGGHALDQQGADREERFPVPRSFEDLNISESLVTAIFLKQAYQAGASTVRGLARSLKLSGPLVESIFHRMKSRQFIEITGMTDDGGFSFNLSAAGKNAALERMQVSRYTGPVPVSIDDYRRAVKTQAVRTTVNRERLMKAYSDLSLDEAMLNRLGPAIASQNAMLLYGPSGTGKTSLAERLLRIFDDVIAIPYAVETEGSIIGIYDPAVHRLAEPAAGYHDPRWAFCHRPCVIVGGELTADMLELKKDADSGSFAAPLHTKANNGIFVIDDFGRQTISPRELLNRWIVPLDRRVDYLNLSSGLKCPVPFEVFVVFSTNLNPSELGDEAFLRRIPNRILVEPISQLVFDEIVERRLASSGWSVEAGAEGHLRRICRKGAGDLRPCYPRDLFRIIESIALFEERVPSLNHEDIDRAGELYFGSHTRSTD